MSEIDSSHNSSVNAPAGHSRRGILGKAVITGLAAVPVVGMMSKSAKAAGPYGQESLTASAKEAFTDILGHEIDHVARLVGVLGKAARPKPTFKGITTTSFDQFVAMARVFEEVGVGAYLGALPIISNKEYLALAGSIALTEAEHTGFLNTFSGYDVTTQAIINKPSAYAKPLTIAQVVSAAGPFVVSLNGGPALTFSATPSAANDVAIVNFALALEFLEKEFYVINVPKYFKV